MTYTTTTIAAISTPPGKGGVAVIRISGRDAGAILDKMFLPMGKTSPKNSPRRQIWGKILRDGECIDDGLATFFPSPNSYTGEDTAEISCHGGVLITEMVLETAFAAGARPAEAGEFTRRAFVNGRLSLTEADGIGLLLEAESEGQIKLASSKSREKLTEKIDALRKNITSLLSSIFARIDYPDEDLGDFTAEETLYALKSIRADLDSLISTYKTGRAVREGIGAVIIGKPNAGKSTFYNALAGEDAAIVTDIPGTTRDILERSVPLGDIILRLADTAGIRENSNDTVERIGIARSKSKAESAELIFALFDGQATLDSEDEEIIKYVKTLNSAKIAVITKVDIASEENIFLVRNRVSSFADRIVEISAKEKDSEAVLAISAAVAELFTDEKITVGYDAVISSARQNASLLRAREFINSSISAYSMGLPQDISSSDIEMALGAISEIDGRAVSEEVVADIFSKFCVGK